jgi:hypothetical protein
MISPTRAFGVFVLSSSGEGVGPVLVERFGISTYVTRGFLDTWGLFTINVHATVWGSSLLLGRKGPVEADFRLRV